MKRFIAYTSIILAAVSFVSCKDFLEKAPKLSQSTELTLSTYDGLNMATLGAYSYLANTGWYGGVRVLESEMRSGNGIKDITHNSNRYATEINWNYTADATSSQWAYSYITIARANNVIDNLEGKGSQHDLNNLLAECLFIRAISHFDCVTLYAQPYTRDNGASLGVPVVLHTDASAKPKRETVATVYQSIIADLLLAEKAIDPEYVREGVTDPKATVTLEAIQALLSRVYLYSGNYQLAADYATKVIESGKFALYTVDNYTEQWNKTEGGSEVIFEIYKDLKNLSNEDCSYMTYPEGAYGDCICSPELFDMYEEGDVRKALYTMDSKETAGLYWTLKYKGKGLYIPDANNTPVLRLSEMYLNRAEAAENGANTGTTAVEDLNAIAVNRGATPYTAGGMQNIREERRKELAWEGHYFFDLARWGQDVKRKADAYIKESNAVITFNGPSAYRWALPIPKRELEVNSNLVQNPGY